MILEQMTFKDSENTGLKILVETERGRKEHFLRKLSFEKKIVKNYHDGNLSESTGKF